MKVKAKSLYKQLKAKKLAGTITPEESKEYKKIKKQKLKKKREYSLTISSSSPAPTQSPAPKTLIPSTQSSTNIKSESENNVVDNKPNLKDNKPNLKDNKPNLKNKKRSKKLKRLDDSLELFDQSPSETESPKKKNIKLSPVISANIISDRNGETKVEKFKEGFKQLVTELDTMTQAHKLQQETHKLEQEQLLKKFYTFADEMGINLEPSTEPTVLAQSSKPKGKTKKMNSFMVFCQKEDRSLTLFQLKEKWAQVSSADRRLLAKEARSMNEINGIIHQKERRKEGKKQKMSAYTAFTQFQMKENKLKFGQVAEIWRTVTEEEKAEYQKKADIINNANNELPNAIDNSD